MSVGFYERMRATAGRLLAPTDAGGLGQGDIELVRYLPGPLPANPWDPTSPQEREITVLDGVARGVAKELVGTPVENGGQIVATDVQVLVASWGGEIDAADVLELDGSPVTVLKVENIPAVGLACAVRMVVRR